MRQPFSSTRIAPPIPGWRGKGLPVYLLLFCSLAFTSIGFAETTRPNRIVIDDFESGDDLVSRLGSEWEPFFKDIGSSRDPITAEVVAAPGSGHELKVSGHLPDDGSPGTWGGIFIDLSQDGTIARDLFQFEQLSFRVRTDDPALYIVRLEDPHLRENSRGIVFPADTVGDEVSIPLWRFAPSHRAATRITFLRAEQIPGASFSLYLDDVSIETATARARTELMEAGIPWAPSVTVAWDRARSRQQPLLMYFTSSIVNRCREFEEEALGQGKFRDLVDGNTLALIDVSTNLDLARRFNVYRVPSFVAMNPSNRQTLLIDPLRYGDNWGKQLSETVRSFTIERVDLPRTNLARSEAQVTLIDDFSDVSAMNRVGGMWHAFSTGDRGDVAHRFVLVESDNFALEIFGKVPDAQPGGMTWAGVSCDLSPNRAIPRNLTGFRALEFSAASSTTGRYGVRLENTQYGPHSTTIVLDTAPTLQRYSIPLHAFTTGVENVTSIVWVAIDPRPGQPFHLILDDVALAR